MATKLDEETDKLLDKADRELKFWAILDKVRFVFNKIIQFVELPFMILTPFMSFTFFLLVIYDVVMGNGLPVMNFICMLASLWAGGTLIRNVFKRWMHQVLDKREGKEDRNYNWYYNGNI